MVIGEQIKKYRLEAKMSQKTLGDRLGISQQQIAQYETGKRTPKIETVEKIAAALGVSTLSLLYGDFDMYKVDYHKTAEYKEIQRETLGFYATIKLLESIYNRAEDIDVNAYHNDSLQYSSNYISVGEGKKKLAISNGNFEKIVESIKSNLVSLVNLTAKSEKEYINELEQRPDIDSLSFSTSERVKIIIEDENGQTPSYLKPL